MPDAHLRNRELADRSTGVRLAREDCAIGAEAPRLRPTISRSQRPFSGCPVWK